MEDFFEDLKNRPKPNLFKRIKFWWKYDGKYYHKEFVRGIKKLWYWFPIIWKDRDWDTHFIYQVMKHKLKAQAKYISDSDRHTRAQQDARRMTICVKLIQLCQDETYAMEYMDYHKDRVWFTPCEDREGSSLYNSEVTSENFDDYFKKYPLIYKKVLRGEGPFTLDGRDKEEVRKVIAMNIAHVNQDRARKLLFKIMEENIEGWWD
jgi:hypothetical protein